MVLNEPIDDRNTIIEGYWENNMLEGYGRMIFNDGSYYQGMFKNSVMNG